VLPGIVGSMQALEALKWILGVGESLAGRLVLFDGLKLRVRELKVHRDPACAVCGDHPTVTAPIDYAAFCGTTAAHDEEAELTPEALRSALEASEPPQVIDVRDPWEWEVVQIAGSRLIPLSRLGDSLTGLDPRREIVTVCHRGVRSMTARELLRGAGFGRVKSLAGGIDAWAARVDPEAARY
jgi:adenylyltransferase/sulfurtransferase